MKRAPNHIAVGGRRVVWAGWGRLLAPRRRRGAAVGPHRSQRRMLREAATDVIDRTTRAAAGVATAQGARSM